jgi:DNA/RNA endonuclease YhcR with UshA esterase domain
MTKLKRICLLSVLAIASVSLTAIAASPTPSKELPEYTALEAAKHVGERAIVTGKIEDVHRAQGGSIFLNMGARHPNEDFTIFIPSKNAEKFPDAEKYDGAVISVTGKIDTHEGKPQIIVSEPSQIKQKEKSSPSPSPDP